MGKKNKMNPFAGKHVGGSGTATRLPSTGKKKKQQRPAATSDGGGGQGGGYSGGGGGQGGGGGRPKRPKSFLGLLAAGAAYAGGCPGLPSSPAFAVYGLPKRCTQLWTLLANVNSPHCLLLPRAALWAWNVWSRAVQLQDDRDVLDRMAARPLRLTEHAACRMDCRCAGLGRARVGGRATAAPRPSATGLRSGIAAQPAAYQRQCHGACFAGSSARARCGRRCARGASTRARASRGCCPAPSTWWMRRWGPRARTCRSVVAMEVAGAAGRVGGRAGAAVNPGALHS